MTVRGERVLVGDDDLGVAAPVLWEPACAGTTVGG